MVFLCFPMVFLWLYRNTVWCHPTWLECPPAHSTHRQKNHHQSLFITTVNEYLLTMVLAIGSRLLLLMPITAHQLLQSSIIYDYFAMGVIEHVLRKAKERQARTSAKISGSNAAKFGP